MSKDIRSYFSRSPRGPTSKNDVKPAKVKKRAVISSDEDEDVKIIDDKPEKHAKKNSSVIKKKDKGPDMKAVDIAAMLGKTPVKRVNVSKKKSHPNDENKKKSDSNDLDDVDFEKSLIELDIEAIEATYYKGKPETNTQRKTEETNGSGKRKKHPSSEDEDVTPKKPKLQKKPKDEEDEKDQVKERPSKRDKASENNEVNERPSKKDKASENDQVNERPPRRDKASENDESKSPKKLKFNNLNKKSSKVPGISTMEINHEEKKTKKKLSEAEVEFLEDRASKKKQSVALYQAYLSRGGARNPGSKPIPEGAPNCLAGLSFVLTGVFDSLERDEATELIQKYGGRVTAGISKKINYIIVGDEAGQSKLAKAESLKIKQISEDELLDLIRNKPPGNSRDIIHNKSRKRDKSPETAKVRSPSRSPEKPTSSASVEKRKRLDSPKKQSPLHQEELKTLKSDTGALQAGDSEYFGEAKALVEKYRPTTMKQIIGQQGDSSNAHKLYNWLSKWHKNRSSSVKPTKPSPYAKNDNGAYFKACLLSGPPGVGKTTSVQVVCKELGFDLLEFNASDTRSKKLLQEEVSGLLSNTTMKGYFTGNSKEDKPTAKHILLMDEVDGMAGNEDRGGLQELIALIKSTDIPIVCICNDRNNPKMRTLANYVYDLRFQKPRVEQIRGAMKSLCCKENIKISNDDLDRLITATNQDIRQVINHLAMLIGDNGLNKIGDSSGSSKLNKDLKLGPWEVVRKVFSAEEHKSMTIHDKSDLFFHDYNISGLFVQENYLSVDPKASKSELLERVAATADSLSMGDQVEKAIRSSMAWSLLPTQACYCSVIPGSLMSGTIRSQINFPSWLGRNSRRTKFDRLLQEVTAHSRLVTGASKEAINMDYMKPLRDAITRPLVEDGAEGVESALKIMNHYHLLREDLDSIIEVSLWPGDRDPMQFIESKVKAAFTRAYNKHSAPMPFVVNTTVSKKKKMATTDDGFIDDDDVDDDGNDGSDGEDGNLDVDKMIKAKKPTASKATASTSKSQVKPSKRGRGRGK